MFGPDTSTGLVPLWHVPGYYAIFFAVGALLWGRTSTDGTPMIERLSRWWGPILPLTLFLVLPFALGATFGEERDWGFASLLQVIYTWGMIVGLMGWFCQRNGAGCGICQIRRTGCTWRTSRS